MAREVLLDVRDLAVRFPTPDGIVNAVSQHNPEVALVQFHCPLVKVAMQHQRIPARARYCRAHTSSDMLASTQSRGTRTSSMKIS